MPSLVIESSGRSAAILRKLTSIGADAGNDVVVEGEGIAPTHAHVKLEGGRFLLMALSRAHPVLVNDKKARRHVLEHGDVFTLGPARLRFDLWDQPTTLETHRDDIAEDVVRAYQRLASFCEALAQRRRVEELLEALMDEVVGLTGANKGFLLMMEDGEPVIRTARKVNRESFAATLAHVSDSIISQVIEEQRPLIVSDALNDTAFNSSLSVMELKLCSVMCVPLIFRGHLLGLIYVGNDNVVNLFEARSLEVLAVFASQAALLLQHAIQLDALKQDNARLRDALEGKRFGDLIGACEPMREVFRKIERVAGTDITVLILGDTGTGKELIAREIHRRSDRADQAFVALNCGAIPRDLMESELFGHRRGAFTGAVDNKIGRFQAASGGTLFLDEIGEMPTNLQVKLLRALQEKVITRVGDTRPQAVDIRVIAATNTNLEQAIEQGRFREDLYYRLNVIGLHMPPLRNRDEDVVLIGRYLLDLYSKEYERPIKGFTRDAIIALRKHTWPGNIRELQNRLKKAVVLADRPQISAEDLDLGADELSDRVLPLAEAKEAYQRRYIDQVLALNDGNRTKTAHDLGVDPRTVFRHLEKTRGENRG